MQNLLGPEDLVTGLDSMREGLQVIDRDWRYVYMNGAAASHGRRQREELIGRTMMECYPGIEQTDMFAAVTRCMEDGVPGSLLNDFVYPDGVTRTFELRFAPCEPGIMVLSIDVSEARRLEEQLRHAQKMEAVGRLAASVAHDFNNLLSVIISYSSMLLEDLREIDPARKDVQAIKDAGDRATALTRQLLAFSRPQAPAPRLLDLNEVVSEMEKMLARLLGEDVELVTRYERGLSKLLADPGNIDQVVMNLAVNARDAMPEGGKLLIETRNVVLDEAYAARHFGARTGPHVMLAVSDTGIGMDRATQERIFEPFFTTKEQGRGTGLGLSTVFGIVQQNGGNVWVYSEVGAGTTFKVYLPVSSAERVPVVESFEATTLKGSETVLVVEDQDDVRQVVVQILRRNGYHVLEARNAGEALLTSERHPRTIDLLLTDVVMPQLSGRELAARLAPARPEMKVLYMSGYTENAVVQHAILDSGVAYLQKPIVPETLARKLREVVEAAPSRSKPPPES